jgi:hypothetical protein
MKAKTSLALAVMLSAIDMGRYLDELLESMPEPKKPDPERQAAAEAKRQRRIERNRRVQQ